MVESKALGAGREMLTGVKREEREKREVLVWIATSSTTRGRGAAFTIAHVTTDLHPLKRNAPDVV